MPHSTSELLRTLEMNSCFQANILAVKAKTLVNQLSTLWDLGCWSELFPLSYPDLSTRSLTAVNHTTGIRSSSDLVGGEAPHPISSSTSSRLLQRCP